MSTLLTTLPSAQGLHGRAHFGSLLVRPSASLSIRVSTPRAVLRAMSVGTKKLKVADPVILPVLVSMMNVLVAGKHTTKMLGHAESMFQNVSSRVRHWMVRHAQANVSVPRLGAPSLASVSRSARKRTVLLGSLVNAAWHIESLLSDFSLKYNTPVKGGA